MRAFFKKLGDGIVAGAKAVGSYVKSAALYGWGVCTYGYNSTSSFVSGAWSNAKETWNANHGFRACLGFGLSMLCVPLIAISWAVAAMVVWYVGFIVIPALLIALVLSLGALAIVALLWLGFISFLAWLGECCFTSEKKPLDAAIETMGEACPA